MMPISTSREFTVMFIFILCCITFQIGLSKQNDTISEEYQASQISSCTCLGQELTFECTVDGDGATYWQGSALQECSNNRVIIRHSQHMNHTQQNTTVECGSTGTVVGTPVSAVNMSYTSQLTLNVSQHLNGSYIECFSDGRRFFGSSKILLSSDDPLPPPSNVTLLHANSALLQFHWSPVLQSCLYKSYFINATGCGECPSSTVSNSLTCINHFGFSVQTCTLSLQTVTCNNVVGTVISQFTFKVQDTPGESNGSVSIVSEYDSQTEMLKRVFLEFNASTFDLDLPKNTNESSIYYTFVLFSPLLNSTCSKATVNASLCQKKICRHVFYLPSLSCVNDTNLLVNVFASDEYDQMLLHSGSVGELENDTTMIKNYLSTIAVSDTFNESNRVTLISTIAAGCIFSLVIIVMVITIIIATAKLVKLKTYPRESTSKRCPTESTITEEQEPMYADIDLKNFNKGKKQNTVGIYSVDRVEYSQLNFQGNSQGTELFRSGEHDFSLQKAHDYCKY